MALPRRDRSVGAAVALRETESVAANRWPWGTRVSGATVGLGRYRMADGAASASCGLGRQVSGALRWPSENSVSWRAGWPWEIGSVMCRRWGRHRWPGNRSVWRAGGPHGEQQQQWRRGGLGEQCLVAPAAALENRVSGRQVAGEPGPVGATVVCMRGGEKVSWRRATVALRENSVSGARGGLERQRPAIGAAGGLGEPVSGRPRFAWKKETVSSVEPALCVSTLHPVRLHSRYNSSQQTESHAPPGIGAAVGLGDTVSWRREWPCENRSVRCRFALTENSSSVAAVSVGWPWDGGRTGHWRRRVAWENRSVGAVVVSGGRTGHWRRGGLRRSSRQWTSPIGLGRQVSRRRVWPGEEQVSAWSRCVEARSQGERPARRGALEEEQSDGRRTEVGILENRRPLGRCAWWPVESGTRTVSVACVGLRTPKNRGRSRTPRWWHLREQVRWPAGSLEKSVKGMAPRVAFGRTAVGARVAYGAYRSVAPVALGEQRQSGAARWPWRTGSGAAAVIGLARDRVKMALRGPNLGHPDRH
ncbi:hypothetical protein C7M84_016741 [Penaeus vannamei]|uniref:Uncharacterized protein n=1 Tax=Penaeus vannamei TaxID=6689 RepID=A0A423SM32_PENVA|nr:hypothetical protein C7M84_016741 [Penaeus vannamei]